MCGINGLILSSFWGNISTVSQEKITQLIETFQKNNVRGPDKTTYIAHTEQHQVFHRLAINGLQFGNQPFVRNMKHSMNHKEQMVSLQCNGEIYNHMEFATTLERLFPNYKFDKSQGDCSVLPDYFAYSMAMKDHLISDEVHKKLNDINGVFAFEYTNHTQKEILLARDRIGVRPLFIALHFHNGTIHAIAWSSTLDNLWPMKSWDGYTTIIPFLPGSYCILNAHTIQDLENRIYLEMDMNSPFFDNNNIDVYYETCVSDALDTIVKPYYVLPNPEFNVLPPSKHLIKHQWNGMKKEVSSRLMKAVQRRLMSERNIGLFCSGGLDSSLIASISTELYHRGQTSSNHRKDTLSTDVPKCPFNLYTIGTPQSPDKISARLVAKSLNANLIDINFSQEDGFANLKEIVKHLGTWDITTIRASTPHYICSKYIRENSEDKVILSGEGADELFQGYLYFCNAPSVFDGKLEAHRLVQNLYQYDVLRSDRATSANGLEVRVPFLDKDILDFIPSIPAEFTDPSWIKHNISWLECTDTEWNYPEITEWMKGTCEKALLRFAFADLMHKDKSMIALPMSILFRQKDAFSDAVGYTWVDYIKDNVNDMPELENEPHKEAGYYMRLFQENYSGLLCEKKKHLGEYWLPKWTDIGEEPSARILFNLNHKHQMDTTR